MLLIKGYALMGMNTLDIENHLVYTAVSTVVMAITADT
jgi:hypothetical protein